MPATAREWGRSGLLLILTVTPLSLAAQHVSPRLALREVLRLGAEDTTLVEPPDRFFRPIQTLSDSAGNIYILDSGHGRIQVFDSSGGFLRTIGYGIGRSPGRFLRPTSMTWAGSDTLLVADHATSNMTIFLLGNASVEQALLPRSVRHPHSVAWLKDDRFVVAALHSGDSSTLQLLTRRFLRLEGMRRWSAARPLIMYAGYGGAFVRSLSDSGFATVTAVPGAAIFYRPDGTATDSIALHTVAPAADSLIVFGSPEGRYGVRSLSVPMVNGVARLTDSTLLLSVFGGDELKTTLLLLHRRAGTLATLEVRDEMGVLGCAGRGRIALRQVLNIEYVVVYRLPSHPGACGPL